MKATNPTTKLGMAAGQLYCAETAGTMSAVDFWCDLNKDFQERFMQKAADADLEAVRQEERDVIETVSVEPVRFVPGSWLEVKNVDEMQAFYLSRLPAMREAARIHGYALGLHGSTRRDLDLIAMPWGDESSSADELAQAIQHAACGISRNGLYIWEEKPQGRIATSFPICVTAWHDMVSAGHVDLSILVPVTQLQASLARVAELEAELGSVENGKCAVFAVDILGNPMRETSPGKWEGCTWGTEECNQLRAKLKLATDALEYHQAQTRPIQQTIEVLSKIKGDTGMIHTSACEKCGQVDAGQTGEYPCKGCGLPMVHDDNVSSETEALAAIKEEV